MVNGRTPFQFRLDESGPISPDGASPLGHIAPFLPSYSRATVAPDNPYPDAFRLPSLPLPLLMRVARFNRKMSFVRPLPIPPIRHVISGVTKDNTGTPLGNCSVDLFTSVADQFKLTTTSDANGNYTVVPASPAVDQFCRAYLVGSPDVAGTTRNDLRGQ
jgi:hypothetical protein